MGGSFAISVSYGGCSGASGYVNFSGVTAYDSLSGFGAPGDGIGIEVDAALTGGTYARWSGQGTGASSGSVHYGMSWSNASVPAGSPVTVQVWVWDAKTFNYIVSPANSYVWASMTYASCTTSAPPPSVSLAQSYYVPDPNKGYSIMATVKVNTPVYASPTSTSATAGNLTAGQTWFIVGTAHNRTWYQVFVGGPDLVWVPASTMSPMGKVPMGKSYSNGDGTFSPAAGASAPYTPGTGGTGGRGSNLPPTPVAPAR